MNDITIALPSPHPAQRYALANARRFNVFDCGRRWGKDVLLERRITKKALHTRQPVAWFAPTYKMLLENWRELRSLLAPVIDRASEAEHRMDLITGAPLEMWSLDNQDAGRGRKYAHVAINEAAMVKNLGNAWAMVLRPTLADYAGSADFGSTPKGLNGFFELWQQAADHPEWARFQFATDTNPHIPPSEIQAMRASLPERVVRQELDAEFIEDGAYFQRVDDAAVIDAPDKPDQHKDHFLVMAADWALSEDYTVLVVACRDCNRVVDWDRFNQIDFTFQREKLYTLAKLWKVYGVLPERNSIGAPNIEIIRERVNVLPGVDGGLGFNTLPTTKPPLIEGLAMALSHHDFKVPKAASDELRAYQVELSTSGHPKFGAPEGLHDDWVMALALAWYAMTVSGYDMVQDPFANW